MVRCGFFGLKGVRMAEGETVNIPQEPFESLAQRAL